MDWCLNDITVCQCDTCSLTGQPGGVMLRVYNGGPQYQQQCIQHVQICNKLSSQSHICYTCMFEIIQVIYKKRFINSKTKKNVSNSEHGMKHFITSNLQPISYYYCYCFQWNDGSRLAFRGDAQLMDVCWCLQVIRAARTWTDLWNATSIQTKLRRTLEDQRRKWL